MIMKIRAKYSNGVLAPLEPLELGEGAEVTVSVEEIRHPQGALAAVLEMVDELRKSYPPDMWDGLPTDLAENKRHYLYGHAKEHD